MPRGKLTPEEKTTMQLARIRTKEERTQAMAMLEQNPQFGNFKLWKNVDSEIVLAVEKAIAQSKEAGRKAKIAKLESELAALRRES